MTATIVHLKFELRARRNGHRPIWNEDRPAIVMLFRIRTPAIAGARIEGIFRPITVPELIGDHPIEGNLNRLSVGRYQPPFDQRNHEGSTRFFNRRVRGHQRVDS